MTNTENAKQIDAKLAAEYHNVEKAKNRINSADNMAQHCKGTWVSNGYGGRKYSTTPAEAWAAIEEEIANGNDARVMMWGKTYSEMVAARQSAQDDLDATYARIFELDRLYTGWSRFFLVTSSTGHVHSSTECHTCRDTTTYGWLPELSGESEADAVTKLGAVLCSVCFASAPVEHQGGKITKAKAAKLAA